MKMNNKNILRGMLSLGIIVSARPLQDIVMASNNTIDNTSTEFIS